MLSNNIKFTNYTLKSKNLIIFKIFKDIKKKYFQNEIKILSTLSKNYKYSYKKTMLNKYKKFDYNMNAGDAIIFDENGIHKGSKTLESERLVLRYFFRPKMNS